MGKRPGPVIGGDLWLRRGADDSHGGYGSDGRRHAQALLQSRTAGCPPLKTQWTPEELKAACDEAEKTSDAKLAALVAVPDDQKTFANTFVAYEEAEADYADAVGRLGFMKDINTDAKVRQAGAECEEEAGKYSVKVGARKDLYLAMKAYLPKAVYDPLDAQDHRLIELTMRDFKRNGLELSDADREKLVSIRKTLAEIETKFSRTSMRTPTRSRQRRRSWPAPGSFMARLKKAPDGKLMVTTKYPDYFPVMENAKSEATRKRMELAFEGREAAKVNIPLLQQAVPSATRPPSCWGPNPRRLRDRGQDGAERQGGRGVPRPHPRAS